MSSRHIRGNLVFRGVLEQTAAGDIVAADMVGKSVILVNKTSGEATAIGLRTMNYDGEGIIIADAKGDAATNNITITPASGNINGSATYVISENYGSICLVWDGTNFVAWATSNPVSSAELAFLNGVTAGTGAVSKAAVLDSDGNFIMPDNGVFGLSRASVAAAGSGASTATVLADQVNAVTASDGTKAVALPAAATTEGPIWVINTVENATLPVYPVNGGNDQINGLAEDAAFVVQGGEAAMFIPTSATQWYARLWSSAAVQKLASEAGVGITAGTGTVYRSSVERQGGIVTTRILIDLTGLSSATDDLDIIGVAGGPAALGQITAARNGTIVAGKVTCLEAPASLTDIDLYSATVGTGEFETGIGTLTETALLTAGEAWTAAMTKVLSAVPAANEYLYLVNGAADTPDTFTTGIFLIELYGTA